MTPILTDVDVLEHLRPEPHAESDRHRRGSQRAATTQSFLAAVLLFVVVADQLSKAWAGHGGAAVDLNAGTSIFVGPSVEAWFEAPVSGACIDVAAAVLLLLFAVTLTRRTRSRSIAVGGTVALAGWGSNLLDRLGLHSLTDPGSTRGAVDFINWHGYVWNLADFAIAIGTTGVLISALRIIVRSAFLPGKRGDMRTPR